MPSLLPTTTSFPTSISPEPSSIAHPTFPLPPCRPPNPSTCKLHHFTPPPPPIIFSRLSILSNLKTLLYCFMYYQLLRNYSSPALDIIDNHLCSWYIICTCSSFSLHFRSFDGSFGTVCNILLSLHERIRYRFYLTIYKYTCIMYS